MRKKYLNSITVILIFLYSIYILFYKKNYYNNIVEVDKDISSSSEYANDNKINENDSFVNSIGNEEIEELKVHIAGEVFAAGVYSVNKGERVIDVVEKAGGFTKDANQKDINLSRIVEDEDYILILKTGDETTLQVSEDSEKINLNKASKEELKSLTGIGDSIAESIIEYREEVGEFRSIDEIKNVNRIGDSLFSSIEDLIIVR